MYGETCSSHSGEGGQQSLQSPIRLTRRGPLISHLLFFDHVILFAEASLSKEEMIWDCVKYFSRCSGLNVNLSKTCVFFSTYMNHKRCSEIRKELGFIQTGDLGKYLGIPFHHKRVGKDSFTEPVDKVKHQLSHWKHWQGELL